MFARTVARRAALPSLARSYSAATTNFKLPDLPYDYAALEPVRALPSGNQLLCANPSRCCVRAARLPPTDRKHARLVSGGCKRRLAGSRRQRPRLADRLR